MNDIDNPWFRLDALAAECLPYYRPIVERPNKEQIRQELIRKIEQTTLNVTETLADHDVPSFNIVKRDTWNNVSFIRGVGVQLKNDASKREINAVRNEKTFAMIIYLLEKIHSLLVNNGFSTKRDVFYQNPTLFGTQASVNCLVEDISQMYGVPRKELKILASSKGLIAGNLHFKDAQGNYINCLGCISGVIIPTDVDSIEVIQSKAKFILVIEKDATFQKLLDDKFQDHVCPCILITGKGYPDINTRELTKKLWLELGIPVLVLVDCDAYGCKFLNIDFVYLEMVPYRVDILCVYKYGSLSMAFNNEYLTVPTLRWLGVHITDVSRLGIPNQATESLTPKDINKLNAILTRPYMMDCPQWANQISKMIECKKKAEIQCLTEISEDYMSKIFLPSKIRLGGYI